MPINELLARRAGLQVVMASWLASFCLFGYRATFAVLKVPISREMHWSSADITTGYSVLMSIYAATAFFSGVILDRWGTKPCYLAASVFGSLGFLLTSGIHNLPGYYASFGILGGIGTGMLWVTSTISVRKWFVGREYARMAGLAFMGGPMAQIVLGLLVKVLVPGYGWRFTAQILAAIIFVSLSLAVGLSRKSPEHYGMRPFGAGPEKLHQSQGLWRMRDSFATYPIWAAILTFLCCLTGEHLIWSQVVSYFVDDLGMNLDNAVNLYSLIGFFGVFSMPLMGIVADRMVQISGQEARGRKMALIAGTLTGVVACFTLLCAGGFMAIGILSCLLFAVYWALIPGAVVGYAGILYGQQSLGRIWGLATLVCMGLGPASGSFLGGAIRDLTGSYRASIAFAMCAFAAATVFAFTLPLAVRRSENSQVLRNAA